MPTQDPLTQLTDALREGKRVPFEWVVEHAADGTIETLWNACEDAQTLLQVYAYAGDRPGLVHAACACARTVLKYVPKGEDRPRVAIETAEAWARGEATLKQVEQASDAAYAAYTADSNAASRASSAALHDAADAEYAVHVAVHVTLSTNAATTAYAAAGAAIVAGAARRRTLAQLAEIVRATIPCPTLAQLTSG